MLQVCTAKSSALLTDRKLESGEPIHTRSRSTQHLRSSLHNRGQAIKPCGRLLSGCLPFTGTRTRSPCVIKNAANLCGPARQRHSRRYNRGQVLRVTALQASQTLRGSRLVWQSTCLNLQLCKRHCEPHSYHERPHIYADNPHQAELVLKFRKLPSFSGHGPEHPKALKALYVLLQLTC